MTAYKKGPWNCPRCTFRNKATRTTCYSCGMPSHLDVIVKPRRHPEDKPEPSSDAPAQAPVDATIHNPTHPLPPGQTPFWWGPRQSGLTEGLKFDGDKPRTDLLDPDAMEEVARVLTFGAKKYAAHNWRKGIAVSRLLGATLRHVFALMRGEDKDPESGLHHSAHAICCLMFLFWTLQNKPELDDRYKKETA